MSIPYRIVIPARMASERLPGKALLDVSGKPLLERVWACADASRAVQVVIATDDERIRNAARAFGAEAVMTARDHASGSDRIAECLDLLGWPDDYLVVNLQGDEPLMPPACLEQVAGLLATDDGADAASLYRPIENAAEVADPNAVKVVVDGAGRALLFSRSVIPSARQWHSVEAAMAAGFRWRRHIGLYAYRAGTLRRFAKLDSGPLEQAERLEQLRILETGGRIVMAEALAPIPAGVDTPEDLERVRRIFAR